MLPASFIRKKRDKQKLSESDIKEFFCGITAGDITDYQASAMLMAIFLNGMDTEETAALTRTMRDSGEHLSWKHLPLPIVDKHSTGGIGDKTSLILLPLCALNGVIIPMMSGRGLGHSGGTLDKLESIPGMNVFPSMSTAQKLAETHGGVFMGQTGELAPLDKKLYALRDVTATVESISLITASILSKKLAEGLDCLVMDVKYGSGAFMESLNDATNLAKSILNVGSACGLRISCLITDMGSPLGKTAGNNLEVIECIEVMTGKGPADTRELSLALAEEMLCLAFPGKDRDALRKKLDDDLNSGRCFEKFCSIIHSQGGDTSVLRSPDKFFRAPVIKDVSAKQSGYVSAINVRELGLLVVNLGGGRKQATDKVDHRVGLSNLAHVGTKLKAGDTVATIHALDENSWQEAANMLVSTYSVSETAVSRPRLIEQKLLR